MKKSEIEKLISENRLIIENTLPGLVISLIIKNNYQIKEDYLIAHISPMVENLKRPDGAKYTKVNNSSKI